MAKLSLIPIHEMEVIGDEMLNFITGGIVDSINCESDQCQGNTGDCTQTNKCKGNERDCTVNTCNTNNKPDTEDHGEGKECKVN